MPQQTIGKRWQIGFASNSTQSTLTALGPTTTKPTRAGFHELPRVASAVDSIVICQPYGSAANNKDFYLKITRWSVDYNTGTPVYVPSAPYIVQCTLGNIAATAYGTNNFLCDTIALIRGDATAKIVSPQNDEPAELWLDMGGAEYIEFEVDIDAGAAAATNANVLWRTLS
jgi:hypothetical protein